MDELPGRAMEVLRLARPWDECSDPGARARVRAGVAFAVGAAPAGAPAQAGQPGSAASLGGLKAKLALASTVLAVIGAGVALKRSPPERVATPAAVVASHIEPAPAEPAPAEPAAPAPTIASEPEQPPSRASRREHAQVRDTLDAEVALLRRVDQAATQGDSERATRYLAQHHARFPSSVLAVEREGFDVLVRCLRRAPDSAQAARDFAARNPHAVLTRRVERECTQATEQP
jgi:hypothetical protein